jgi:hypothetical protein
MLDREEALRLLWRPGNNCPIILLILGISAKTSGEDEKIMTTRANTEIEQDPAVTMAAIFPILA